MRDESVVLSCWWVTCFKCSECHRSYVWTPAVPRHLPETRPQEDGDEKPPLGVVWMSMCWYTSCKSTGGMATTHQKVYCLWSYGNWVFYYIWPRWGGLAETMKVHVLTWNHGLDGCQRGVCGVSMGEILCLKQEVRWSGVYMEWVGGLGGAVCCKGTDRVAPGSSCVPSVWVPSPIAALLSELGGLQVNANNSATSQRARGRVLHTVAKRGGRRHGDVTHWLVHCQLPISPSPSWHTAVAMLSFEQPMNRSYHHWEVIRFWSRQ